ncbi:MAG: hypothetical protein ACXQTS_02685 [Candidatus Methanospirareceae archaeon]
MIEGALGKICDAMRRVASAFEKSGYPFSEMVRYCEFNFPEQPLEVPNLVDKIRSINIPVAEVVSKIFGEELKLYSFSLSHPNTPLTDDWTLTIDTFFPDAITKKFDAITLDAENALRGDKLLTKICSRGIHIRR